MSRTSSPGDGSSVSCVGLEKSGAGLTRGIGTGQVATMVLWLGW